MLVQIFKDPALRPHANRVRKDISRTLIIIFTKKNQCGLAKEK